MSKAARMIRGKLREAGFKRKMLNPDGTLIRPPGKQLLASAVNTALSAYSGRGNIEVYALGDGVYFEVMDGYKLTGQKPDVAQPQPGSVVIARQTYTQGDCSAMIDSYSGYLHLGRAPRASEKPIIVDGLNGERLMRELNALIPPPEQANSQ